MIVGSRHSTEMPACLTPVMLPSLATALVSLEFLLIGATLPHPFCGGTWIHEQKAFSQISRMIAREVAFVLI